MGQNVGQLWIELGADVARLRKDMGEATSIVKSFKSEAESAFKGIQTAALSYLSFQGITQIFKATVAAAAEEEQSLLRLEAVLRAHGVTNKEVVRIYDDMATKMQMTTRYTDDQVRSATQLLLSYNVMPSEIEKIIKTASNLAVVTGDLQSASQALGQAYNGNTKQLKVYFPEIKRAMDAGMTFEQILKTLNERFGDLAQKEMSGYSGQVNQLTKEWKEFGESLGNAVIPALTEVLKLLNSMGTENTNPQAFEQGPWMAADEYNHQQSTGKKTDTVDWDALYKGWKDQNELLKADMVATHNVIEKTDKAIKSSVMSATELRDLYIKAMAEQYAAAEEFNEKYLADEKKRQEQFDAEVDKQNKAIVEQQVIALAEFYAEKEQKIREIGELEREQIQLQREETELLFNDIISMANSAGQYGAGAAKMATSLQGFTNAYTGNDEWEGKLNAANDYYQALNSLAEKSASQIAQTDAAYNNLVEMQKQASFQRTARMTSSMFGAMSGAALAYYNASGNQSRTAFQIYKGIAVAETIISTLAAAQQAFYSGEKMTGSMAGGFAFSAVATIAGMARVAQILSTNPGTSAMPSYSGSYATPTISSASESTADTMDKTRSQNINIYVYGSVVDHQKFAREIVTKLNEAESDGVH